MDLFSPILSSSFLDPKHLLDSFGFTGLVIIIFLESAFMPAPGDSLLFVAGIFTIEGADHHLNLWAVLIATALAAILGNQAGYWFGRRVGNSLYNRPDSKFFKKEHLDKTHAYFERFGPKTILLARVIPVVRGLAPIVAGAGRMNYRSFLFYNVLGGVLWVAAFVLLGKFAGDSIGADKIDKYTVPLALVVIVVTSIPLYFEYRRTKKHLAAEPSGSANKVIEEEVAE